MNEFLERLQKAEEIAREEFPKNEWFLNVTKFADGDFEIEADHSFDKNEKGNVLRKRIYITPEKMKWMVVEITESDSGIIHEQQEYNRNS